MKSPPMKKMLFARLICVGLLVCLSNTSLAVSRVADSQVRLEGDLPCFGVADPYENADDAVELLGLVVYDTRTRPARKVWSLRSSAKAPVKLTADQCVVYGTAPNGMIASKNALALERDVIYRVYLNSRPQNPRSPTRGYTRSFCLKGNSDTQMEIREIRWDNANKRWRYDVCEETPAAQSGGGQINMQKSAQ